MAQPDATQIVAGAGLLFVAPLGTQLPTLDEAPPNASQTVASQSAGGALTARTIFYRITGVINGVESAAVAEASFAASANQLVTLTFTLDNRINAQYDHFNVYASTTTGSELKQTNGTNLVITAGVGTWQEPTTGVAGAGSPPTSVGSGEFPVVWPAAWKQVGYTDAGIDVTYTPSIKDILVDEEMAPVFKILTEEKCAIATHLAQATLQNLNYSIAASTYTDETIPSNAVVLEAGSAAALNFTMVGIQAPAPGTNVARVIILFKALANAAVAIKIQRKDKVVIPVTFEAMADPTKPAGKRLIRIVDLTSGAH